MTVQEIIKQTETFTKDQKQQLAYYFLFSTIDENKKQEFIKLVHYKDDFENSKEKNTLKYSGAEDFGEIDMENLRNDIYSHL